MSVRTFRDWLQQELDIRGWKAAELHRRTGIDESTISKWMKPGGGNPAPPSCLLIADVFGMDANEVLRAAGRLPAMAEDSPTYVAREIDPRAISIARILASDPERFEEWLEIGEVFLRRSANTR